MSLDQAAMTAPVIDATVPNFHPYNCHMAVIHWALIALGKNDQLAQDTVQQITRQYCPHCKGAHPNIGSLQNDAYGRIFCQHATPLGAVAVGDVVIVPNIGRPAHSMVVVSTNGGIGIRGFNNTGTFPAAGAPYLQYDATTRMLANRVAPGLNPVFQINQQEFLTKVRNLSRLFSVHTAMQAV